MTTYTFKVTGKPDFTVEAEKPGKAMGFANDHFGSLPQGAWMERIHPNTYRWNLGNFFD